MKKIGKIKKFIRKFNKKIVLWLSYHGEAVLTISVCTAILILIYGGIYSYYYYWNPANIFYETTLENEIKKALKETKTYERPLSLIANLHELKGQITSNFGWFFWALISLTGLACGLSLAHRGRKIQKKQWENEINIYELQLKSHLQERYENSCSMLGNDVMAVRIAGCQALKSLSINDKSMKLQCVRFLFAFIRNPYLDDVNKKTILDNGGYEFEYEDQIFKDLFFPDVFLRTDIQEAADILSFIYKHYGDEGLYKEEFKLPPYFLINQMKNPLSLIKVNLKEIKCENAHLVGANLRGAKLEEAELKGAYLQHAKLKRAKLRESILHGADLQHAKLQRAKLNRADLQGAKLQHAELQRASLWGADLNGANLSDADISLTNMQEAKGLTPEQILSAIWGIDKKGKGGPPYLPEELLDDLELDMWLAIPNYDLSEIDEDEDEDEYEYEGVDEYDYI